MSDFVQAAVTILALINPAIWGASVLSAFGISLDAFQVAGGVVLVWMGFSMLTGSGHSGSPEGASGGAEAPSLLPLVMFAASPGTERAGRATSSPPVSWV
jgi:multiple antibiotic resistance protein